MIRRFRLFSTGSARPGVVAALAFALASPSCSDQPLPGTMLGRYAVVGVSTSNTCGPGLQPPDPWTFGVELSKDKSTLYWSWLDNTPPISGTLDGTLSTSIVTTQSSNVDTAADGGPGLCTLNRDDALHVTLSSDAAAATFTGTLSYSFAASSGSDCADQLAGAGGVYTALPCSIGYSLTAKKD